MQQNDAQAIIDFAKERCGAAAMSLTRGDADAVTAMLVPNGMKLEGVKHLLDAYLKVPERKKGAASVTTLGSFIDYTNRHKLTESVVFLDDTASPVLRTVFNAHKPAGEIANGDAGWQDHQVIYNFPLSDEWKAWTGLKDWITQPELALFLEDRITDVLDPATDGGEIAQKFAKNLGLTLCAPAKLLELSRGLSITVDQRVAESGNLSTGERTLVFSEEHKDQAGQQLKVPGAFCIAVPVFKLGAVFRIPVRLRYRIQQGRTHWQLAPHRMDLVREEAIKDASIEVHNKTGLTVFRGVPEK